MKYTLELEEFELVTVLAGLSTLSMTVNSKAILSRGQREELGSLVVRVNEEIVRPAASSDPDAYNRQTHETVNRMLKETALTLLARHDKGSG